MSIFIPNRSIKLPKDISVPQSLSPSVFETHRRDQAFQMSKRFDGALVDVVSGVKSASIISGVRYGIVNGVVTEFGVNQPALEDDGLRGCPAFTQRAKMSEILTDDVWFRPNPSQVYTPGGNRFIYTGGANSEYLLDQFIGDIPGGVSNKIITVVAFASAINYPQKFRIKNAHSGVIDNFSDDITINEPTFLYLKVQNSESVGYGQSIGIVSSTDDQPFDINIGFNISEANFIYPYSPNNTMSNVSFVSEAATATTGTSYDLDDALLSRLKTALRGANAQGHLELTFKSSVDSGWLANSTNLNIFSIDNNSQKPCYFSKNSDGTLLNFFLNDGTNAAPSAQTPLSVGQIIKISLDWGTHSTGQKMRITVNGVKSSLVNFSGSFGSQDLRFFFDNTVHAGWIKKDSLKIFDRPRW